MKKLPQTIDSLWDIRSAGKCVIYYGWMHPDCPYHSSSEKPRYTSKRCPSFDSCPTPKKLMDGQKRVGGRFDMLLGGIKLCFFWAGIIVLGVCACEKISGWYAIPAIVLFLISFGLQSDVGEEYESSGEGGLLD